MNPQIQKLWDQAAEYTAAYPSGQNNSWDTQVNFMNHFAELIVRECADIAADQSAIRPEYRIRRHFGVEE